MFNRPRKGPDIFSYVEHIEDKVTHVMCLWTAQVLVDEGVDIMQYAEKA